MFAVQGVECPEEGCEGFAGAGGGDDEGVVAVADALPGAFLGGGGCAEGGAEPVAYGGGEVGGGVEEGNCDQYWSAIEPVLVTHRKQYWSPREVVLVRRVTSSG